MAKAAKRRKTKRSTQRNKCDRLFSLLVRARDKVCCKCGTSQHLQCAHIFSRGYMNTRWDFRNAIALCSGCHKWFTHHPIEWEDFIIARVGEEEFYAVRALACRTDIKVDYDAVLKDLEERMAA